MYKLAARMSTEGEFQLGGFELNELNHYAYKRACKLRTESSQKRGAKLSQHLDRLYSLAIYPDQIVTLMPILREMEELQDELVAATVELSFQRDEIASMKTQLDQLLLERDSFVNVGKVVEHVSVRQQRRKLTQFRDSTEAALWFAESFGLIPKALTVRTVHSEDQITWTRSFQ